MKKLVFLLTFLLLLLGAAPLAAQGAKLADSATAANYGEAICCAADSAELPNEGMTADDPHEHVMQIAPYVAPTCTEGGYAPFVCERCGYMIKTDPEKPLGHDYKPVYVWADDDATVTATMVCTRCQKPGLTETAKVRVEVTTKPTCTAAGEQTAYAAFNCKSFYTQFKTTPLEQLRHRPVLMRAVSPTCTSEGIDVHWRCDLCGGVFTDETASEQLPEAPRLKKLPHTLYEMTEVPPTCTEDGLAAYWRCEMCLQYFADETGTPAMFPLPVLHATGHTPVTDAPVAPTCTATGLTAGTHCSVCGAVVTAQETVPMTEHTDADNDGLCDACGDMMTGGDHCPQCGKLHNAGLLDGFVGFFHRLMYRLTHLFG